MHEIRLRALRSTDTAFMDVSNKLSYPNEKLKPRRKNSSGIYEIAQELIIDLNKIPQMGTMEKLKIYRDFKQNLEI